MAGGSQRRHARRVRPAAGTRQPNAGTTRHTCAMSIARGAESQDRHLSNRQM
ncbi:dof zinc finger protein [Burkholderia multivorans CGD2M]|uniref:Dof zinc finger protein n=1 Tax=Burkholderia multivorans CGD2 TaxID=513052 RepID=B9BRM7_9BURK|nr:dof zinc finger protein [Burkholderia multivorans CGD2]EEE12070.1 dof zinc finger protein [Burkholderia multivorans CGD2M]